MLKNFLEEYAPVVGAVTGLAISSISYMWVTAPLDLTGGGLAGARLLFVIVALAVTAIGYYIGDGI